MTTSSTAAPTAAHRQSALRVPATAGAPNAASVVNGWLKSPGHCVNIMGPQYREMGIAYALSETGESGIYWAQTFATAR